MGRIKLDVPKSFHFKTTIPVRITDVNYGGHMGNDALLSIMHEARIQFLKKWNYSEMNVEGAGLIMADVAIQYKNEAFAGDELEIEMTAYDFALTSFDLFYYITEKKSQKVIALAKTNMVTFNYQERKMMEVPFSFASIFQS